MNQRSHIVSFDDVRRTSRTSSSAASAAVSSSARTQRSARTEGAARTQRTSRSAWEVRSESARRSVRSERKVANSRADAGAGAGERGRVRAGVAAGAGERAGGRERERERGRVATPSPSFGERLSAKVSAAKRSIAKDKAERSFARQYGSGESSRAGAASGADGAASGAPRAAVYKGEMGTQHKRAARMQGEAPHRERGVSATPSKKRRFASSPAFIVSAAVAACMLFGCVFLYSPAQQCYQEIRERDRLQAEYDAICARNEAIQSEVDALSTSAGIEDRAREEFGWVKEGENAVSVTGVDVPDESTFTGNVVPGSVPAPETWYSGILDPLFGVE